MDWVVTSDTHFNPSECWGHKDKESQAGVLPLLGLGLWMSPSGLQFSHPEYEKTKIGLGWPFSHIKVAGIYIC